METIDILTVDIYFKIFSYLYPSLNYLYLVNNKFFKYSLILLDKLNKIKVIDDVLEFNNINFDDIFNILNIYANYKYLRLNHINDNIDICKLLKLINISSEITIFISNSNIFISSDINTYKLNIFNCKIDVEQSMNKINIIDSKYININKINILRNIFLSLELTNVFEFIYINTICDIKTIEMNNCEKYMIYNRNKYLLKIIFPNGDFILKNEEKLCRGK